MDFNHWDIILFIPIVFAAWKGFRNGIIIEIASIAGLIAGVYVAANFSQVVADMLVEYTSAEGSWIGYAAFILTFIGVVFGVYTLAKVIEKAINLIALKLVNKLLGLLFGALKMTLIISIVLNLFGWLDQYIPILQKSQPEKSLMFQSVLMVAPAILPVLTDTDWMKQSTEVLSPLFVDEEE